MQLERESNEEVLPFFESRRTYLERSSDGDEHTGA
jgi:hypothetical protein